MESKMFIYIFLFIYLEVLSSDFQARAFENLALGKKARQSSTLLPFWGPEKAVDGVISTSLSTNNCAVTCDDQTTAHWFVDLGKVMAINHITIYYRMEEQWETKYRGRFAGFYLYIAKDIRKNHGEQYYHEIQTGPNSPSPNMTIECKTLGRYVILYNERDPKVAYPDFYSKIAILELCEVEVYGCQNIHQEECMKCPPNCYKGQCDISSGKCRSCPGGLQGDYCCKPTKYGRNCTERCGLCKDNQPCNSVTGICANGCSEGFYGDKCITECPLGYYGFKCTGVCSNKCATPGLCDRFTGTCFDECLPGFSGDRCLNVCRPGKYGRNCRERCGLCKDKKPCDSVKGFCANGCSEGFYGDKCITECPLGYYGFNCTSACSKTCSTPSVCDRFTGTCFDGCLPGFSGDRCLRDDGFGCQFVVYILFFAAFILLLMLLRNRMCTTITADSSKGRYTLLKKDII